MSNDARGVFTALENIFQSALTQLPLELSVFLLSILEEIIVPIPAPVLLFTAGSLVHDKNGSLIYLFWIAIIAALGKTIGTWGLYLIANKAEHFIFSKNANVFGVSAKQIDGIKKYFNGTWRDSMFLFALRAIPFVPTAHVSAFCGLISFKLREFFVASFLGLLFRQFFFLYLGYQGKQVYEAFNSTYGNLESVVGLVIVVAMGVLVFYWLLKKKKEKK